MFNLLWLQSGSCAGCSISLLNAESPDLITCFKSAKQILRHLLDKILMCYHFG
jgi:Ni,Fe-hydrogenase I small subunit